MVSRVHQLSQVPRALVGHTALSTKCPGKLGPVPEGPWGGTTLLVTRDCT